MRRLVRLDSWLLASQRLNWQSYYNPKHDWVFDGPIQLPVHLHRNWSDYTRPRRSPLSLTDVRLCRVSYDWHLGINIQQSLTGMLLPPSNSCLADYSSVLDCLLTTGMLFWIVLGIKAKSEDIFYFLTFLLLNAVNKSCNRPVKSDENTLFSCFDHFSFLSVMNQLRTDWTVSVITLTAYSSYFLFLSFSSFFFLHFTICVHVFDFQRGD